MKLNRRGFFGFGAGAVAAAPKVLNDPYWYQTKSVAMNSIPGVASTDELLRLEAEREAVKKQIDFQYIKKLKRIASGDITEEEIGANTIKERPSYRAFRPLKSISDNARDFLQQRAEEEYERRNMIKKAQEALERYDKTGALRQIFGWYNEVERQVNGYDDVR